MLVYVSMICYVGSGASPDLHPEERQEEEWHRHEARPNARPLHP
jgi:hypothetical protein